MIKKINKTIISIIVAVLMMPIVCYFAYTGISNANASEPFDGKYEFEYGKWDKSSDITVKSDNNFNGFSGDGYLYLKQSGWAEINFTVDTAGTYEFKIYSASDQNKQNWLYTTGSFNNGNVLYTTGDNTWHSQTIKLSLEAGTHKLGISPDWGYVGLDYVQITAPDGATVTPIYSNKPETTTSNSESNTQSNEEFNGKYEFEYGKWNKGSDITVNSDNNFNGFSGDGYLYLKQSGWAEINFTVDTAGTYEFKIYSASDQNKQNWLYTTGSFNNGNVLYTTGDNTWHSQTIKLSLEAGTHKLGVSPDWGYVGLDYVQIIAPDGATVTPIYTNKPEHTTSELESNIESSTISQVESNTESYNESYFKYEFEYGKWNKDSDITVKSDDKFNSFSGDGYLYLRQSGWAEINFTVDTAGTYEFKIYSASKQNQQNWLYTTGSFKDGNILYTTGNSSWNSQTVKLTLTEGTHKLGVSPNWGYIGLDYVEIIAPENATITPIYTNKPNPTTSELESNVESSTVSQAESNVESNTESGSNSSTESRIESSPESQTESNNENSNSVSQTTTNYEYDKMGRLKKIIYGPNNYVEYNYDANGNIVNVNVVN